MSFSPLCLSESLQVKNNMLVKGSIKKLVFVLGLLAMAANADMFNTSAPFNQTLTCAERNIQGPVEFPFLPELLPFVVRCVLILYYMYVCFFGVALNIWTPYLVWKFKSLQNMSFYFAVQISILNTFSSFFIVFPSLVSVIANEWLLGEPMCILLGAVHTIAISLRAILMMILVLDRFCLVFMPYWYPRNRAKIMYTLLPIGYLISALAPIPFGVLDCYAFSTASWNCQWTDSCSHECAMTRQIYGLALLVPMNIIPVLLYAALHCKARRTRGHTQTTQDIAVDNQEVKREWRATITSLLFLDTVLVSVIPGVISLVANSVSAATGSFDSIWFYLIDNITVNLFILLRVLDPIFILRNRDIKDALAKLKWLPPFWYTCKCEDITCKPPPEDANNNQI